MKQISCLSFFICLLLQCNMAFAQLPIIKEKEITLHTPTGDIEGILRLPQSEKPVPLVLIISGSGPTDRDGNQAMIPNNSLKFLSEALYSNGIASVCFDKRGIAKSMKSGRGEQNTTLDDYIDDVERWVDTLILDKRFSEIDVLGHSEGSLIGMIASKKNKHVSKFISVSGLGKPMLDLLEEQLSKSKALDMDTVHYYTERLKKGELISNVPNYLMVLFRPSVQPYLISTTKYIPTQIISELTIPVLIVQGETDIQVTEQDAELLSQANSKAKKVIIPKMNHVLKDCENTDQQNQMKTYTDPTIPINTELVDAITQFVLQSN